MDDYISRQAAIDALGERPLNWDDDEFTWGLVAQFYADRRMLEAVPSADVQPVVRCWNCIWWDDCPSSTITPNFHKCKRVGRMSMPSDGFCSFGEQKDV